MIVLTDDVAVLPMSKKEDNLSSSTSSSHAAGESTAATSRKNSSTWDSQHDLAGKGVLKRSPCHTRPVYGVAMHHGMKLSYHREPCMHFKSCSRWITMKVTHGRSKWQNRIYHFLLVTTSVLHYVRDITTFTVYVTACDLEKSFIFYLHKAQLNFWQLGEELKCKIVSFLAEWTRTKWPVIINIKTEPRIYLLFAFALDDD